MAWNFNVVLSSPTYGAAVPADGPQPDIAIDGKCLWFISKTTVKCMDITAWHMSIDSDANVIDKRGDQGWGTFVAVTVPKATNRIVAFDDKAYITQSDYTATPSQFNSIVVVNTAGQIVETLKMPELMNSNLVIDNGKMWMMSHATNSNFQQLLYWYDLTTQVWQSYPVPVRHQTVERYLACDHSGHILICDYNNLSITKFTNTGAYLTTTRVAASSGAANREPNFITTDQNRNTYVASFNGMISKMDTATDAFTMFSAGLGTVAALADDGTHQWVASKKRASVVSYNGSLYECVESHIGRLPPTALQDPVKWATLSEGEATDGAWTEGAYYVDGKADLLRINRANQTLRHFSTSERDIQIEDPSGSTMIDTTVNKVLVSPSFTCATKDGVVTVPQYVWVVTNQCRVLGFPTDAMFRENFYEMKGFAMMSFGNYDYTGD